MKAKEIFNKLRDKACSKHECVVKSAIVGNDVIAKRWIITLPGNKEANIQLFEFAFEKGSGKVTYQLVAYQNNTPYLFEDGGLLKVMRTVERKFPILI